MNRRTPIIAGVVAALLAVLAVVLLVVPRVGDIRRAEDQLQAAQGEELVFQARLSQLEAAAEKVPMFRQRLARFQLSVPDLAELPDLINKLQDAADSAGVDFFAIAPGIPVAVPQGGATEVPAQIQVIGGFFPVEEFLFRLEALQRASKVMGVEIAAGPDGLPQIDMRLDTRFYTTDLEAGPGAAPAPSAGASPAPSQPSGTLTPTPPAPSPSSPAPTTGA